jgi:hypothetical protein
VVTQGGSDLTLPCPCFRTSRCGCWRSTTPAGKLGSLRPVAGYYLQSVSAEIDFYQTDDLRFPVMASLGWAGV